MGRTKGATSAAKVVKSDSGNKELPNVGKHGYTPEETEAAFFLFMDDQKKNEPGLKLSDAVGLWNARHIDEKNVSALALRIVVVEINFACFLFAGVPKERAQAV